MLQQTEDLGEKGGFRGIWRSLEGGEKRRRESHKLPFFKHFKRKQQASRSTKDFTRHRFLNGGAFVRIFNSFSD